MAKPDAYPDWATADEVDPVSLQNNVVEPLAAKKLIGWERREKPPRQWFNWLWRYVGLWVRYLDEQVDALLLQVAELFQFGIAEWDIAREFSIGSVTNVAGVLYESQTNANTGNDPTTDDGTNWLPIKDNRIAIATVTPAANADVTLDRDEYGADLLILVDGAWLAAHNIIVPDVTRRYWVSNSAGTYDATIKTAAGTGVVVSAGSDRIVMCDGTNVIDPIASGYVLQSRGATETESGIIELATTSEVAALTDTARAVTPQGLKSVIPGNTYTDFAASRAFDTTYTNSNDYPMFVMITIEFTALGSAVQFLIDGSVFASVNSDESRQQVVSLFIPPGATYRANNTGGTPVIERWSELLRA